MIMQQGNFLMNTQQARRKKILTSSVVFVLQKGSGTKLLNYYNLDNNNKTILKKKDLEEKWDL